MCLACWYGSKYPRWNASTPAHALDLKKYASTKRFQPAALWLVEKGVAGQNFVISLYALAPVLWKKFRWPSVIHSSSNVYRAISILWHLWSPQELSLKHRLSLYLMSLNRDCTVLLLYTMQLHRRPRLKSNINLFSLQSRKLAVSFYSPLHYWRKLWQWHSTLWK